MTHTTDDKRNNIMTKCKATPDAARPKSPAKVKRTIKRVKAQIEKGAAQAKRVKASGGGTFTTVDIAKEHGINPKTLRARIRRNIDTWEQLFKDGGKHVFADNKTTRGKIDALLS